MKENRTGAVLSEVNRPGRMRAFLVTLVVLASVLAPGQERDADGDRPHHPPSQKTIAAAIERLRISVNGKASVTNVCQSQGHEFRVEESSEITAIDGCKLTVETRKKTTSPDSNQGVDFTLHVDLRDLTSPCAIEPQTFSACKPLDAAVIKVMSRVQPGKSVAVTRKSSSGSEGVRQTVRKDVSFFFSNALAAKRAARALDHAVDACGGKEWPDDDDLP